MVKISKKVLYFLWFGLFASLFQNVGYAQDTATLGKEMVRIYKGDGYYEFNSDGVPLIGIIATRMENNRVKFVTCTNRAFELDMDRLKQSKAKCPPEKRYPGIWSVNSNNIEPIFKVDDDLNLTKVRLDGVIQSIGLPSTYKLPTSATVPNSLVGYAFKDSDGKKSLMIFDLVKPKP